MIGEIQNRIQQKIEDADLILVGIGKELDTEMEEKEFYQRCFSVYQKIQGKKSNQALLNLAKILQGKNYFVISTNVDECLYLAGFRHLVCPCGRESFFQCSENCSNFVWENAAYLQELFSKSEGQEILLPKCPKCGKPADFNRIQFHKKEFYCEHYLPEWEKYMKWLSGTLNKRLLLLEFGVDFIYPQLIRWPFEKTALLNQKAFLIRIHESLSHVPEELKGRAEAIAVNSKKLLETMK